MQSFACSVDIIDPHANTEELFHEYGFRLKENPTNDYDAIIVAVNHREYSKFTEADFKGMMRDDKGIIIDLKGIYRHIITNIDYWSL